MQPLYHTKVSVNLHKFSVAFRVQMITFCSNYSRLNLETKKTLRKDTEHR